MQLATSRYSRKLSGWHSGATTTVVPGVSTRKMSSSVLVDVHIQVAPYISVSEGHHIAEQVMGQLREEYDEVSDIMVHIDPEDDETAAPSKHLPDRITLLESITPFLKALAC